MPFNLLLLPLLGGYVFISCWNHTRFDAKRYSGERLIFHAALAGFVFLACAYIITYAIALLKPEITLWWKTFVPFEYSGTSVLAFGLAVTAWWPLNLTVSDHRTEARKAVEQWGDFLEILINRSIRETKWNSPGLVDTEISPLKNRDRGVHWNRRDGGLRERSSSRRSGWSPTRAAQTPCPLKRGKSDPPAQCSRNTSLQIGCMRRSTGSTTLWPRPSARRSRSQSRPPG